MKSVKVEDAVGMVLAHDLTKIVPGVFKGAAFRKGHIIRQEDIEELKDAGKYNVFVVTLDDGKVHESEAAQRIAVAASAEELILTEVLEGKVNIKAAARGLLKINKQAQYEVNRLGKMALVSLHDNTLVEKSQIVAASKIIPLTIEREEIEKAEQICRQNSPIIDVKPLFPLKTGIIITGSEVYYGRIKDKFGDMLKAKICLYGGEVLDIQFAPDETEFIHKLILEEIEKGAQVVLVSGGMAVDADDVTPKAIENASTEVITYGIPLLPGAMCMIAYHNQVPIIGIPACAMYNKTTVLDIIYPRVLAKEHLTRDDIISLGHGGLCLNCAECRYPVCPFGK
jgi:molybdopterin biosynthesis enzyme MoaB